MSGFSNKDFRAFAAKKRSVEDDEAAKAAASVVTEERLLQRAKDKARAKARAISKQEYKARKANEAKAPSGAVYRDRADERRRGHDKDHEHLADEVTNEALPEHLQKYMGGREDRAHLVKGLDLLLMERSKQRGDDEDEIEIENKLESEFLTGNQSSRKTNESVFEPEVKSEIAHKLYRKVIELYKKRRAPTRMQPKTDAFLPGRMMFEFDVNPLISSGIPTTLKRSKDDWPETTVRMKVVVPTVVRDALDEVLDFVRSGRTDRRKKTIKPSPSVPVFKAPTPIVRQNSFEEDDIFGDVGDDYVCDVGDNENIQISAPVSQSYFNGETKSESTVSAPHNDIRKAVLLAKKVASKAGVFDSKTNTRTPMLLNAMEDDNDIYAADISYGVYGDDDDDDDAPRSGTNTASRQDARRVAVKGAKEQRKLNSEWQKISTMIDKRKGNESKSRPALKKTRHQ